MDSIIYLKTRCNSRVAVEASLFRTIEFLCFLLGLAPNVMSKADVAFSADEALRKAHRAYLSSLKVSSASFSWSSAVSR